MQRHAYLSPLQSILDFCGLAKVGLFYRARQKSHTRTK